MTTTRYWAGSGGFQELDLDVLGTSILRGNYRTGIGIKPAESTNLPMPGSLFRSLKPRFFGDLAWPPVDPSAPVLDYNIIPASYRFFNGVDPEADTTAPKLTEITPVTSPTNDSTPAYSFSSTEAGTVSFGGACTSATGLAETGINTIEFASLYDGTYTDCTITVTDGSSNVSNTLSVSPFTVNAGNPNPNLRKKCVVPVLSGLKLKAAKKLIRAGRCTFGKVTERFSKKIGKGKVIASSPRAGTVRKAKAKVNVSVSLGRKSRGAKR